MRRDVDLATVCASAFVADGESRRPPAFIGRAVGVVFEILVRRAVRNDRHIGRVDDARADQRVCGCLVSVVRIAAREDQPTGGPDICSAAAGRYGRGRISAAAKHHTSPAFYGLRAGQIERAQSVERGFTELVRLYEVRKRRHAGGHEDRHDGQGYHQLDNRNSHGASWSAGKTSLRHHCNRQVGETVKLVGRVPHSLPT